jgi:hypothetical protein
VSEVPRLCITSDLRIDGLGAVQVSPAYLDMRGSKPIMQVAPAAMRRATLDARDLLGDTVRNSGGLGSTSR